MTKFALLAAGMLACITWLMLPGQAAPTQGQPPAAQKPSAAQQPTLVDKSAPLVLPAAKEEPADPVITQAIEAYAAAYNKHDAAALAQFWAKEGVSVDVESGERLVGREAIRKHFEAHFKESPGTRLALRLEHVRKVRPDVVSIEGTATVQSLGEAPSENNFYALLVKEGDRWLLEEAKETARPAVAGPYDALKNLEWMVGSWTDSTSGVEVQSHVRWSNGKTFLLRQYSVTYENENQNSYSGTQVIGWDPRTKMIRSWSFGSDGSFGESTWAQAGQEWRVRYSHVQVDGSVHSGLQLMTPDREGQVTVQTVGREIDGEPAPSTVPVKTMRRSASTEPRPNTPDIAPPAQNPNK